ncbi:MAG TPA: bifunctional diguanylate cyclase/phosphodiesterase [Solirubrobacteraceae bacterium]|nr:bifunctional diguanylate cyclase/phosphodiesterase [Solirubrobacteraceae bacterium]
MANYDVEAAGDASPARGVAPLAALIGRCAERGRGIGQRASWTQGLGFRLRLLLTLGATLGAIGVLGYVLLAGQLRADQIKEYERTQRNDALILEAAGRSVPNVSATDPVFQELVTSMGQRPGVTETILINPHDAVVASKYAAAEGTTDPDPRLLSALSHGTSYGGHDDDPGRTRDYEFVAPVSLPGGRYAFQTSFDHRTLDRTLGDLRQSVGLIWLLALVAGGLVFHCVGGRSLMRSHQIALRRATRDGLTDLHNHGAFRDELATAIAQAARYEEPLSLLLLDLDDFTLFNDRYGHSRGDQLLIDVATVLRDGRPSDRVFRIGSDEFGLLLPHTDAAGACVRARRLLRALADLPVRASIGISGTAREIAGEVLRAQAGAALTQARRHGGSDVVHFHEIGNAVTLVSPDKQQALVRMLDLGALTACYQPIWDLEHRTLLGIEALGRPDQSFGFAGPADAFDVAEQIGRVHALDVLCATRALAIGPDLPPGALLFINLSPQTLDLDTDGDDWFSVAVERARLEPGRVVIEVTERFGGRTDAVVSTLHRLRAAGFKLALDDVGTGNAGLEMLRALDADFVKIDRSVVTAATTEPTARAVLMAMATFGSGTGAYVIAEGIEDQETLRFVTGLSQAAETIIRGGQGYGLGRPSAEIDPAPPMLLHS